MNKLKYLAIGFLTLFASSVFAESISLNYSETQKNGEGVVTKGAWELQGSKPLNEDADLVVKGTLSNNHRTPGYGVGIETGAKIKLVLQDGVIGWVQPALALQFPEAHTSYLGYVVDAGVDWKVGKFTTTPAVSYSNDFGGVRDNGQKTVGIKLSYSLTDKWNIDGRVRHEYNQSGLDSNRVYAGASYKF